MPIHYIGLNFYGLYKRQNYDGSDSESITQLAMNVLRNEGREIDLAPETNLLIKVSEKSIERIVMKGWLRKAG